MPDCVVLLYFIRHMTHYCLHPNSYNVNASGIRVLARDHKPGCAMIYLLMVCDIVCLTRLIVTKSCVAVSLVGAVL